MKKIIITIIFLSLIGYFAFKVYSFAEEKKEQIIIDVADADLDGTNQVRYQDNLILYDAQFERNEYGYELLVDADGGYVIDKGEMVVLLKDTYILSGHGTAADLLQSIEIGDIVKIIEGRVLFTRDLCNSNLKKLQLRNDEINTLIEQKNQGLYDIDNAKIEELNECISEAKRDFIINFLLSEIDAERIDDKVNAIDSLINEKYYCTIESRAVELRGLWHRPNKSGIRETDLSGVKNFVNRIYELGINTLYVETFWHGMTSYHSDFLGCCHPQVSKYTYGEYGNDYLLALITECHKVGIEVHAWFEALNVTDAYGNFNDYINPEWMVYDLNGDLSDSFIDPSNPEVKNFLLDIISEMLTKYDFDGISYDYIRYSETGDFDGYKDGGFSENSINLFSLQYGYQGEDLLNDVLNSEQIRSLWQEFKQNNISSLVKAMSDCVRAIDPEIIISTSPYGHVEHAKSVYMQDVTLWCEEEYVDVILPMIFTDDIDFYVESTEKFIDISANAWVCPGVYSLYNGESLLHTERLLEAISPLTIGNSIFASQNIISHNPRYADDVRSVLSGSSHEGYAVSPTADVNEVFSAWKKNLCDRYYRIYREKLGQNETEIIEAFFAKTNQSIDDASDIVILQKELENLKFEISGLSNTAVRDRLTEQIDYLYSILDWNISRYLIAIDIER